MDRGTAVTGPRVLLTISRAWTQWSTVREVLTRVLTEHPGSVLMHGDARHGDRTTAGIWRSLGGTDNPIPAEWGTCDPETDVACRKPHRRHRKDGTEWCPTAGHRRNTAMVESGPVLCLSFIRDHSRGASDCTRKAEEAGIPTIRYTHQEDV